MSAVIETRGAAKWYGSVIGINGIDLDLEPGITGLLGPNGAGKSTLLRLVTGQIRPSAGSVNVLGESVWNHPRVRRQLGYAPDVDAFYEEMTTRQFVRTMARLCGLRKRQAAERTEQALAEVGLTDEAQKRLRACSKGTRQRAKLAQAIVHDPQILILDEPLVGIDPSGRVEILNLLRRFCDRGRTIVLSSHILEDIESLTDRVVLMAAGRVLASGSVRHIRTLLSEHPLTVRVVTRTPRRLATELLQLTAVSGVSLPSENDDSPGGDDDQGHDHGDEAPSLVVRIVKAEAFFRALPQIVARCELDVRGVEALDDSAAAVFDYLLRQASFGGDRQWLP